MLGYGDVFLSPVSTTIGAVFALTASLQLLSIYNQIVYLTYVKERCVLPIAEDMSLILIALCESF